MAENPFEAEPVASVALEICALQESGVLGRSRKLRQLFDYIASCTLQNRTPKEAEIGSEVFGRPSNFDPAQDAVVRVYIHKLRLRLDAVYLGPRADAAVKLHIPRGEYRLEPRPTDAPAPIDPPPEKPVVSPVRWIAMLVLGLVLGSALAWLFAQASLPPSIGHDLRIRKSQVWAPILNSDLPTLIVVGDYYIFGESDDGIETNRLVREYQVGSKADLQDFIVHHSEKAGHYLDLDLRYLPVGSATALNNVARIIDMRKSASPVKVMLASALTPAMIREDNIIYVGYLSGLGPLKNATFIGSQFSIKSSYDQILDNRTKTSYSSEGGGPDQDGKIYKDFGYFSAFKGPGRNYIIVIAGTRDIGLMQMSEVATEKDSLDVITRRARASHALEALYLVDGLNRQNVNGRILAAYPVDEEAKWQTEGAVSPAFPPG